MRLRVMHGVVEQRRAVIRRSPDGQVVVTSEEPADAAVALARAGDRTALITLIDRCRGAILSAIASVRPPASVDLEEAAHLARVQIFEKFADGYDGSGPPCSWMAVVARNRTRDLIRSEARHSNRSVSIDLVEAEVAVPPQTARVEAWDLINRVLLELPDSDAELLTLHYLHGLSRHELADRLGYSYEGIRSKLSRACVKAHEILKANES